MKIKVRSHDSPPAWWNKEVKKRNGLFTSTSYWGDFYKIFCYGKTKYLEVLVDGKRSMLILLVDIPLGGTIVPSWMSKIIGLVPSLRSYTFHLQPLITDNKLNKNQVKLEAVSKQVLKYILDLAKEEKKSIIPADFICFKNLSSAVTLRKKFNTKVDIIATSRLALQGNEEQMYKSMDESVKSGIRKCLKQDVTVRMLPVSEIMTFYDGLKSGWGMYDLAVNPSRFFTTLGTLFPEQVKYFVAYYNDQVVAGSGIMEFGGSILEFSMYVTPFGKTNKLAGGDLVKWEIIRYAIGKRIKLLDMNMIAVTEKGHLDEKIKNINFYKLKWGGSPLFGLTFHAMSPRVRVIQKIKQRLMGH